VLASQGMQANQQVTFLTDGGEDIRDLPRHLNPRAEHLLDWFHLTMRITVLTQLAKGLRSAPEIPSDVAAQLQRVKWFLWHGNIFRARQTIDELNADLADTGGESGKLTKAVREFGGYLAANASAIPNYGERRLAGETISTSFVESAVNQVISKRMVKEAADAMEPPRRAPTTPDPHPDPQRHPRRRLPTLVPRLHPHNRSRAPGRVASHGLSRSRTTPRSPRPATGSSNPPLSPPEPAASLTFATSPRRRLRSRDINPSGPGS